MPYAPGSHPDVIKDLPAHAQTIWIAAFNSAYRAFEGSESEKEAAAFRVAWAAVRKKYKQDEDGTWHEKVAKQPHTYHTDKMRRCIDHLLDKGFGEGSAHAICYTALGPGANKAGQVDDLGPEHEAFGPEHVACMRYFMADGFSKDEAHRICHMAANEESLSLDKRAFFAGDRIVVEMNQGLDGYTALSYKAIDAELGIYVNEGSAPDGVREAAALYFLTSSGWDVARAVTWARGWASENNQVVKRVGIESDDESDDPIYPPGFAPFHRGHLRKSVADPALASKQIAFAVVMTPWTVDTQGHIVTDEDVEEAAYRYAKNPVVGIMHEEWGDIGYPVESFLSRDGDPDFPITGTWVMGIKFSDMPWQKILNQEFMGLSIGGIIEEEEEIVVNG